MLSGLPQKTKGVIALPTARTKANRKYNEKAYDRLYITVDKGKKEQIESHAKPLGESLNGFVNRAIDEAIVRDNTKGGGRYAGI